MFPKSVLPILGIVSLQAGLMCSSGFAATRAASVSVSATVVAGCQVSRAPFAAKGNVPESKGWALPISMSCSLPLPYQIAVTNSARTGLSPLPGPLPAQLASTRLNIAGPSSYADTHNPGLLQPRNRPDDSTEESNHGLVSLLSTSFPADSGRRSAEDAYSETITVTITY